MNDLYMVPHSENRTARIRVSKELLHQVLHFPGWSHIVADRDVDLVVWCSEFPVVPDGEPLPRATPNYVKYDPPIQLKSWDLSGAERAKVVVE